MLLHDQVGTRQYVPPGLLPSEIDRMAWWVRDITHTGRLCGRSIRFTTWTSSLLRNFIWARFSRGWSFRARGRSLCVINQFAPCIVKRDARSATVLQTHFFGEHVEIDLCCMPC